MKSIAIIGAGISGLYLANLFKDNEDYKVTIYEKKSSIELNEGYGIQLSVNSVELLNKIGFSSLTEEEKFNPKKIDFYEIKNAKKICDLEISRFNSENCKYTTLKRSNLLQFLKKKLNEETIKYNHSIDRIEFDKDLINIIFNNKKITCDYLVISDGVFSKGKSLISNNESKAIYNNSIAIRGSISKENLRNTNDENISLFLGSDFHYVVYPLNKEKKFNFIGVLKYQLTAKELDNYNLLKEETFIKGIRDKIQNEFSTNVLDNINNFKCFPVFVSKGYLEPGKNIFLLGDAFFALPPSFAQGASQSIEGASELFDNIVNNKKNFYDNRATKIKMINRRSKLNQFAFHVSNPVVFFFRNISLRLLVKNKKFLENYLGKIYDN